DDRNVVAPLADNRNLIAPFADRSTREFLSGLLGAAAQHDTLRAGTAFLGNRLGILYGKLF
ncbi:MAG: hypothetical protein ACK4UU_01845, partial [Fimbriimonadales bacterium]